MFPFDGHGNQITYTIRDYGSGDQHADRTKYLNEDSAKRHDVLWCPNYEFKASLRVVEIERGRSALRIWMRDREGRRYSLFGKYLLPLMQGGLSAGWTPEYIWTFAKRGMNYGMICKDLVA